MDHLACFIPAMLALGVRARAVAGDKADEFLEVAEELGETCWQMYAQMPTGERPPPRGWWFRGTMLRDETLDLPVMPCLRGEVGVSADDTSDPQRQSRIPDNTNTSAKPGASTWTCAGAGVAKRASATTCRALCGTHDAGAWRADVQPDRSIPYRRLRILRS